MPRGGRPGDTEKGEIFMHLLPLSLALFLASALTPAPAPAAPPVRVEANRAAEVRLEARNRHDDPFNELAVDAVFTDPRGKVLRVPAFWAGGTAWKVRYSSPVAGLLRFRTEASDAADGGLHGVEGTVEVVPYGGSNPLFIHGGPRAVPGRRHLEHGDGTPFFWLADTWWMGLCKRLRWPEEFRTLAADRKGKGFTVVQIVAGLYPDMHPFDPRGANEAGFPWEEGYARIRPEYFDAADARLAHLVEEGLAPCIVGAWGYFLPWMGVERLERHWRYLVARYGAWPVVWCAAGEANLPWYLAKGFPYDDREAVKGWTEVLRFIRAIDPYRRPLTIHPTAIRRYTSRHATEDPSLLDFDLLQTPHGQGEAVPVTVGAVRESYGASPLLPVIDGEASYEMLGDSLPTRWTRTMFWVCLMNGAAGHTYGANGIWQCNRRGEPHGASPHGGSYGKISWDEAMALPGSSQVSLGKRLLEEHPWHRFEPHPEWASCPPVTLLGLEGASWIWFPEGDPSRDAPAEKRSFRRTFEIPGGTAVAAAALRISADDAFSAWINGQAIGSGADWRAGSQFDVARHLRPGRNVIAVRAGNNPVALPANPAGLIGRLGGSGIRRFRLGPGPGHRAPRRGALGPPGIDGGPRPRAAVGGDPRDGPDGLRPPEAPRRGPSARRRRGVVGDGLRSRLGGEVGDRRDSRRCRRLLDLPASSGGRRGLAAHPRAREMNQPILPLGDIDRGATDRRRRSGLS
jgi:hypothetical protein